MTKTFDREEALYRDIINDLKRRKAEHRMENLRKFSLIALIFAILITSAYGLFTKIYTRVDKSADNATIITEPAEIYSPENGDDSVTTPETNIITNSSAASVENFDENYVKKEEEDSTNSYEIVTKDATDSSELDLVNTSNTNLLYNLTDSEINMLVCAVQHETNNTPSYYVQGDLDTVQQLMTASIVNRIGVPGFGTGFSTPYSLEEVLANESQYDNLLNELWWFDCNDSSTRRNVMAVLTGEVWVPSDLYFERCSSYGEDWYTAQINFENQYNSCSTYYMAETYEAKYKYGVGVFIIFGRNPGGAY